MLFASSIYHSPFLRLADSSAKERPADNACDDADGKLSGNNDQPRQEIGTEEQCRPEKQTGWNHLLVVRSEE